MKTNNKKISLSNHVLQMKFMKKTAIETQEELALEEQNKLIDDEHWYLDVVHEKKIESKVGSVIIQPSYSIFDDIGFGRMSFNGFNPQIEKLMKQGDNDSKEESDKEKEIDDEEMADHYTSSLGKTINKKFQSKGVFKSKEHKVKRLGT